MNEYVITTEGLSKQFGKKWAVRDLALQVPKGSVFGLLGPNGAGKSTTIHMLMGLLPPTAGRVSVLQMDPHKEDLEVKRRVGYVAEVHGFYEWMTVDDTIRLVRPYYPTWDQVLCRTLLNQFKLNEEDRVGTLSKGQRAKLALLLAIAYHPELLILDEPTGGLDPAARRNFIETILAEFQEEGKTILVSSHLLNEFSGLLDYVAFVREGQLELVSRLDALQQKTKRARLLFRDAAPTGLQIEGTRLGTVNGREAQLTCRAFDPETTLDALKATGAEQVIVEDMTLEDIFVELVGS